MILTTKRISPIKEGTYKTKIVDIRFYDNVATKKGVAQKLVYCFAVFTDEGIIELKTNVFVNDYPDSNFTKFKKSVLKFFDTDTLDTDDHIGLTVKAKFSVFTTKDGDEYPQLEWYAPCSHNDDKTDIENKDDFGGQNNE